MNSRGSIAESMIGKTYNYLTVLGIHHRDKNSAAIFSCRCNACGRTTLVNYSNLKSGNIKSCGCMRAKLLRDFRIDNLVGKTFGFLTVEKLHHISNNAYWQCKCVCGNITVVNSQALKRGTIRSCGCKRIELFKLARTKYKTEELVRLNRIFGGMMSRCYNPNSESFKDYGARGIFICDEWLDDKTRFFNWALANGYASDKSIDRWPDNNGPYAPWNCRWATPTEQARNTRSTRYITVGDTTTVLYDWMKLFPKFHLWCNRMYCTPNKFDGEGNAICGFSDEEASGELIRIIDDFAREIGADAGSTPVSKLISIYKQTKHQKEL